jgi:hypothetical protein
MDLYVNYGYNSTQGTYSVHRVYGSHFDVENAVAVNYTNTINGWKTIGIFVLNPDNPSATDTVTYERNDATTFTGTQSMAQCVTPYDSIYLLSDPVTDIGGVGDSPFAIGIDVIDVSGNLDFGQLNTIILDEVDEYFNRPTTAYCNWSVYTLGQGHNTLYTLICKDLVPQAPYTENDYEIYVGVTSNADYDGANVGTFAYTAQHFDISYDDLYYGMFEQEQAQATTQGHFFLSAVLRHYDTEGAVIDDTYKFRINTTTGYIESEGTQTGGTIEFNYDTPAEEDDTFDVTADDLPGQAPGQNLSVDNLLTTSYVLTDTTLKAFGRYIWNNDLTTQMYAYQTSPIENILSCRRIPFAETGTATTEIKLGNVSIPIAANICESLHRFQVGGVHNLPTSIFTDSNGKHHPWLAFSDFVQVSIYLPYVGIQKIPNTFCWGKTPNSATPSIYARDITIEYIYDVVFGTCAACLYCDGTMFATYNGSCAIDIPITASNRAQIEHSLIKTGVNGAAASANKVVEGLTSLNPLGAITGAINTAFSTYSQMKADQITADIHYQTSGGFSSQVASLMSGDVYIFIQYPDYKEESTYKHEYGYPCNLSLNLSNLHGYTEIDHGVDLSSIPCFDDEKVYLEQALTNGFYL